MSQSVWFDAFRLIVLVPQDQEDSAGAAIWRLLESRRCRAELRRTMRHMIRHYPVLAAVRVRRSV